MPTTTCRSSGRCREDIRSLKSLILFGIRGMAAYAHHAFVLGYEDEEIGRFCQGALCRRRDWGMEELLPIVLEGRRAKPATMALLDKANTETFGTPVPTSVPPHDRKRPFIVVSGHDLRDLKLLLEQTDGKGVNVYTHGEMLPAHGYPELKSTPSSKGNFGTAWQSQQKEFQNIPAPCSLRQTASCRRERATRTASTTSVVGYPELQHIGEEKDFSPLLNRPSRSAATRKTSTSPASTAAETVTTGFARNAVLSVAGQVIDGVKSGAIRHFFLVGGCDGARRAGITTPSLWKQAPKDTVILTLACGKCRFNDLDLGTIGGIPRLLDIGQCNDAYSAIQIALALASAFGCGVNELPLSMVLSWYEQKAVAILLTLLHLGIGTSASARRFRPSSPNVLSYLVEHYAIAPTTTPEEDLKTLLGA